MLNRKNVLPDVFGQTHGSAPTVEKMNVSNAYTDHSLYWMRTFPLLDA